MFYFNFLSKATDKSGTFHTRRNPTFTSSPDYDYDKAACAEHLFGAKQMET